MLHTTPVRFRRINSNKSWNTGNGSPDALCFTVDKPSVVIVGIGVFGGSGNYDYEVELMEEVCTVLCQLCLNFDALGSRILFYFLFLFIDQQ